MNKLSLRSKRLRAWMLSASCLVATTSSLARAEEALCDGEWGPRAFSIHIGENPSEGQPLQPYDPTKPLEPYDILGDHYLFGTKGVVYKAFGQFMSKEDGKEGLKTVYEMGNLYTGAYMPRLTNLGPRLVSPSSTCKVDRTNPVFDSATWILEKDKVLLVGTSTSCTKGSFTKKLTVVSCDGKKNLLTDTVAAPCDARRINTCIHTLTPGTFLFDHHYSPPGSGTSVFIRAYDTAKRKKLKSLDWVNDGGPEAEIMGVRDVDGDGLPEIVRDIAGSGKSTSVLKFVRGKFLEVKSP